MHDLHAGVGHHEVARAELLHHAVETGLDLLLVRNVHADRERRKTRVRQLLCNGFRPGEVQVGNDDCPVLFRHLFRTCLADTGRRARNLCCFHLLFLLIPCEVFFDGSYYSGPKHKHQ